jgi:tetraacyldisaccharide 4'-kinase
MTGASQLLEAAWYRGAWWLWLLRPVELLFRLLAAGRRLCYQAGLLKIYRAATPVVVVGNITVGGTGKTPVVIALVEALQERGLYPGVVSRGYGADGGDFPRAVGADSTASECGDEPLLIHRRTGAPCMVGPDRSAAVQELLKHHPVDLVISDDGLQHYALGRDLEVALLDGERGLGNGFCLPAGPLREPASRLASVDFVLYRNGAEAESAISYEPQAWVNLASGEQRALESFAGLAVVAMAGIGQPAQFFATVRALGAEARERVFPDHHRFTAGDFAGQAVGPILMTEKDAVKCRSLAGENAWFLRINARLPSRLVDAVAHHANA